MVVIEKAPAKINLGLKIICKRNDGYHNILSIFQAVDLYDEIEITSANKTELICSHPEVPTNSENLILKADNLLRKQYSNLHPVCFTLKKHIPIGAGLGGGSTDAAAALRGLKSSHNLDIADNLLDEYALELGSDVPFFLKQGTAVVSGRGNIIEAINWPYNFTYVIVYPNFALSTSWAYGNLKKIPGDYSTYKKMIDNLKKKFCKI